MNPDSLLERLKQRKLVQWALAYLAGAWVLLQVFGELRDTFAWPPVIVQAITVLLGVGFFVALVLAWYHGERGQQRVSGVELLMLATLLLVAGAAVAMVGRGRSATPTAPSLTAASSVAPPAAASERSIAVLPFANLSESRENAYFTDGITEDILTHLSKVGELKVISRTSVMQYKGTTKPLKQIARELGVGHVLEGSVRREGDQVRISAQLINAATDEHLWAETYDRKLTSIFQIQSEIAEQIARALQAKLSPAERGRIAAGNASDLTAYEYHLKGRDARRRARSRVELDAAIRLLKEALALDPKYAPAQAELASAYMFYSPYGGLSWIDSATVAARKAIAAAPDLADGYRALGSAYTASGRFREALTQYERAVERNPNHPEAAAQMAHLNESRGSLDEALRWGKRAVALEPTSSINYERVGDLYAGLLMLAEAESWYRRGLRVEPDNASIRMSLAVLHLIRGDSLGAAAALDSARAIAPATPSFAERTGQFELRRGNLAAAERDFERAVSVGPGQGNGWIGLAYVHMKRGERAKAEALLRKAEALTERWLREGDEGSRPHCYRMRIHAIRGAQDAAFRAAEECSAQGAVLYWSLRFDPRIETMRGDPRFPPLVARVKAKIDRMRARVEQQGI